MNTRGDDRGVRIVGARKGKKVLYKAKNENSETQGKEMRVIIEFRIKI